MFEVPESDIVEVRIDEEVIKGNKPIEFVRAETAVVKIDTDEPGVKNSNESAADKEHNATKLKKYNAWRENIKCIVSVQLWDEKI